jgi:hypothetical protein
MRITIVTVSLALLATACLSPVRALDMPADVSIKGEYAKVFMFLGDRLRESRPLAENCRQETRDWAQTIEAGEKSKSSEPPSQVPVFGRRYDISSIVGGQRYFSVIRMSATDIDGVYNAIDISTILWDSRANKRITMAPFFKETADGGPTMTALFAAAASGLTVKIGEAKTAALVKTLRPSLTGIGAASLAPSTSQDKSSGLNFHFELPVPGRYAFSEAVVFVPWTTFGRYLSPQGSTIFGGNWRERYIW